MKYVLVPVELTPAMIEAGCAAQSFGDEQLSADDLRLKWASMLAAAPQTNISEEEIGYPDTIVTEFRVLHPGHPDYERPSATTPQGIATGGVFAGNSLHSFDLNAGAFKRTPASFQMSISSPLKQDVQSTVPSWSGATIGKPLGMWIYGPKTPAYYQSGDRLAQGMLDALTRSTLGWWKEHMHDLHPVGVNEGNAYGPNRTPDFVKIAAHVSGADLAELGIREQFHSVIDINTGEFTLADGPSPGSES